MPQHLHRLDMSTRLSPEMRSLLAVLVAQLNEIRASCGMGALSYDVIHAMTLARLREELCTQARQRAEGG